MTMHTDPETTDAVAQVLTDLTDVLRGYETMLSRAEPDLLPVIQRLHAMHGAHEKALLPHLARLGGETAGAGSAMGMVHSAVATLRDWVGALDASALPQILDGEQMIVDSYDRAIAATTPGSSLNGVLQDQCAGLRAQIATLKS